MELGRDRTITEIVSRLRAAKGGEGVVKVSGTWGAFAHLLAGYVSEQTARPILYISAHIDDADKLVDDVKTFSAVQARLLAAWEGTDQSADATDEIYAARLKLVWDISSGTVGSSPAKTVIAASVQSLCQPVPKPEALQAGALTLQVGAELALEKIVRWLVDNGFERVERVDLPGQFAQRGGIVDIYAPLLSADSPAETAQQDVAGPQGQAVRIEMFADTIESIRKIDPDTQRSLCPVEQVAVISAVCGSELDQTELFTNILPQNTIVIIEEPKTVEEVARVFIERAGDSGSLYGWEDIRAGLERYTQLHISRFAAGEQDTLTVGVKSIQRFQQKAASLWSGRKAALDELVQQAKQGKTVYLYCEAAAEIERVTEIIKQNHRAIPTRLKLVQGFVHQGFAIDTLNTIVITHHELFGQYALRRRSRPIRASMPVDTLADLQVGDYVVHASYGIGKFVGVKTITEKGRQNEYLTIRYADGVTIQVSVNNIALVQKFIGTSPKRPKLSKVGSKRWQKQKEKVARSVESLASELLEVQAKRNAMGGIAFGEDSNWQREFEESFAYQETPDQTTAAEQIKADMQRPAAMDRLLCGDVGYGKTELAMRAAFKAVENNKQVAVLVPTTVLSVQHGRTFTERFADFPITIEVLNRFRTPREAADIIERTKKGAVDILIGTHRLLSGDVGFKDLGLVIIDEEQRFGVEHKEKLKRLRVNVDVLTMTATPIPRTLHMSLLGLRDISSLQSPPLDRRAIVTTVTAYHKELVRKAIVRELNRQGQVFFLHNRVKTIDKKAWEIERLLEGTGARITIAHGRMPKSELEKSMIDFVTGNTDVLVCTTIIESGLDIPNANTIFIDNADHFGLAELHQLRGRVGRYKHRAYAYLLLPPDRPVTPLAAKRLKAIEEYSHLGAGFRIALRDLEIRGAGNILGPEQSGHIQLVGYQMYCELLAQAVRRLKGEPTRALPSVNIDLDLAGYIPKSYIPAERYRMDAYRKIAVARTPDDLAQIKTELADVYGPIPEQVQSLLEIGELRIAAAGLGIKGIFVSGRNLIFSFDEKATSKSRLLFVEVNARFTVADEKTVYLHLDENYLEPGTLLMLLRKILRLPAPSRSRL